ncbi:MAG TPA: CopG family ribbon-helix-helix protein [Nitrososphaerales archaeon]|nr:CopG family ribbon-helix-helix protein [Nitrososphaerales archaeon]
MPIISLSLPSSMMKEMDELQESYGFTGRSELVRAAIRLMIDDNREKNSLQGEVSGLVVVTHDQDDEEPVTKLKHDYDDIIKTHIHSKVTPSVCIELFLVHGGADKVASMSKAFEAQDEMKSTKFIRV